MASRFDRFTKPYLDSRVPFALLEPVTDGGGSTVGVLCRFVNEAGAEALGAAPEALQGLRLCKVCGFAPEAFAPLAGVAFSGSSASFSVQTGLGRQVHITCYQPIYGLAACILAVPGASGARTAPLRAEELPSAAVLIEVSRGDIRALSFNRALCELCRWSRREFLNRFADRPGLLVQEEDRPALLQCLLDAARSGQSVCHEFRLLRRTGRPLWAELRAEPAAVSGGVSLFRALVLDVEQRHAAAEQLTAARGELEALRSEQERLRAALAQARVDAGELEYRVELCGLLLRRGGCVCVDYDPAADSARVEMPAGVGRTESRTVRGYLQTPAGLEHVRPDFRESVRLRLQQALERPQSGRFLYPGEYGGQGERWYEASFVALTDAAERVRRIILRAADISLRKTGEARFRALKFRGGTLPVQVQTELLLDLTADRLVSAAGSLSVQLQLLPGSAAHACLTRLAACIPEGPERDGFSAVFSREGLLRSFRDGESHLGAEQRFATEPGIDSWMHFAAELAENPADGHIAAACRLTDVSDRRCRDTALAALSAQGCAFLYLLGDGGFRRCGGWAEGLPEAGTDFRAAVRAWAASASFSPELRRRLTADGESALPLCIPLRRGDTTVSVLCELFTLEDGRRLLTGRALPENFAASRRETGESHEHSGD